MGSWTDGMIGGGLLALGATVGAMVALSGVEPKKETPKDPAAAIQPAQPGAMQPGAMQPGAMQPGAVDANGQPVPAGQQPTGAGQPAPGTQPAPAPGQPAAPPDDDNPFG